MQITKKQGAILYNIGAMVSYVSLVMLLADSVHVAQHHEKVSFTRVGFAMTWLIATVIKAPYKLYRIWLRISTLVQMLIFAGVCFFYAVGGIEQKILG